MNDFVATVALLLAMLCLLNALFIWIEDQWS